MNRVYAMALALAATGIVLSPAIASAQDERSASISYSDLDLTTEDGIAALNQRIERAARYVCGLDDVNLGTRLRSREARQCVSEARENIEESLAEVVDL